jgi:hypothetical protein
MTEPDDLLAAVHALTRPHVDHFTQKTDEGELVKIHSIEQPSLLKQLYAAVNPSNNKSAGSASAPWTRNLIDGDALFEYAKMASAVKSWCLMLAVIPGKDTGKNLDAWYVAFNATAQEDGHHDWYRTELRRWASLIRNIMEPPKRFEITTPCPVCASETWTNPDGEQILHPILVEYRVTPEGNPVRPRARCRATDCAAVWENLEAIEELGAELAEKHNTAASDTTVISGYPDHTIRTTTKELV